MDIREYLLDTGQLAADEAMRALDVLRENRGFPVSDEDLDSLFCETSLERRLAEIEGE